jgi:PAS domain S-box-containing protein
MAEQNRAEEELRRSAAYLAQAQRLTRTGIWVWNPVTDHAFASEDAYRMFGLGPGEERARTLADFSRRIHAADRATFEQAIDVALNEHTDLEVSYRVVHADGSVRHMHLLGHPSPTSTNEVREYIGCVVDLTEEKRAEAAHAYQAQETALRGDVNDVLAQADSFPGMLQACTEAIVRHLDVAFARIWTLRRGRSVLELQASAGLYTQLNGVHSRVPVGHLKIGQIASTRAPHLTNDVMNDPRISDKVWAKREGMVAFAGYPLVVDERVVGVMAMFARRALELETLDTLASIATLIAQGIERKRSEEELRRSAAYLAEGQRLSHTGSWAWNLRTGERYWSHEAFRIFGFEPAEVPPPFDEMLARIDPRDAAGVRKVIEEALETHKPFQCWHRMCLAGQPMRYVETRGHAVHDDSGRVVDLIGTHIDITERWRASRRLRREIQSRFDAVLAERTRIARDIHDGFLQDIAGIALQIAAVLPHVRTTPDSAAERLERILELTERTSREARQAVVGMRVRGDSADLVSAVDDAARRTAAHSTLALSVSVSGRPRPVSALVSDVVVSIAHEAITNVVKHAGAKTVSVSLIFHRKTFSLVVSDDGRGLALPTDSVAVDSHLGLVGMRERATSVGAAFSVASVPGGGTKIQVEFPGGR